MSKSLLEILASKRKIIVTDYSRKVIEYLGLFFATGWFFIFVLPTVLEHFGWG